jgi:DNA-binding NarL/FixJ family response regulator
MPRRSPAPVPAPPSAPLARQARAALARAAARDRRQQAPRAVTARTSVLLHSTQPLLRAGLRAALERHPDISVVGDPGAAGGDGTAALARGGPRPDVVVVDADGPTDAAADTVRRILSTPGLAAEVVAVAEPGAGIRHLVAILRAGARGLLFRDDPLPWLVQAIRAVATGEGLLSPAATRRLLDSYLLTLAPPPPPEAAALAGLSPREREVFDLLGRGLSNAEIARHLLIGERTVKFHVSNLLAKLDLRDRVQAAVLAGTIVS